MKKQRIMRFDTDIKRETGDGYENINELLEDGYEVKSTASCDDYVEYVLEKEVPSEEMNDCCRAIVKYAKKNQVTGLHYCSVCGTKLHFISPDVSSEEYYLNGTVHRIEAVTLPVVKNDAEMEK